jgi:hypothetical protein
VYQRKGTPSRASGLIFPSAQAAAEREFGSLFFSSRARRGTRFFSSRMRPVAQMAGATNKPAPELLPGPAMLCWRVGRGRQAFQWLAARHEMVFEKGRCGRGLKVAAVVTVARHPKHHTNGAVALSTRRTAGDCRSPIRVANWSATD